MQGIRRLSMGSRTAVRFPAAVALSVLMSSAVFAQLSVVSGATYQPVVAPGSLATVFGTSFTDAAQTGTPDASGTLPRRLNGVSVMIAGEQCGLYYVSPTQINFVMPASTPTGNVVATIQSSSGSSLTKLI